ncbi:hypothetical protein C6P44_004219 [Monosporozyma unispora]|nr:hypothetical protein C6P44_004219 [Kazachstania unispora]
MSNTSLLNDIHLSNNTANNNITTQTNSPSSSRNNSTISLDKYHEPSSIEKFNLLKKFSNSSSNSDSPSPTDTNNNNNNNNNTINTTAITNGNLLNTQNSFALPPISSFDNLVRAAERQYKTTTTTHNNNKVNTQEKIHKEIILKKNENANGAKKITGNKINKPRRKKQCPICFNYYANLSTHKSTHLTPEDRPHRCSICNRGFARNNDLIRHQKRHWKENNRIDSTMSEHDKLITLHKIKGTFKCPFNSTLIQLDMEIYPYKSRPLQFETSNCHSTGIFSRCDTYKNHLRALHFEYPPGTKKKDRSSTPGRCRNCGAKFNNVDEWLNDHVGKTCGYSYH